MEFDPKQFLANNPPLSQDQFDPSQFIANNPTQDQTSQFDPKQFLANNPAPTQPSASTPAPIVPMDIVKKYASDYDNRSSDDQKKIVDNIKNQRDAYSGIEGTKNDTFLLGGIGSFLGNAGRNMTDNNPILQSEKNVLNRGEEGGKALLASGAADITGGINSLTHNTANGQNYLNPLDEAGKVMNAQYLQPSGDLGNYQAKVLNVNQADIDSLYNQNPLFQATRIASDVGLDPQNFIPLGTIGKGLRALNGLFDAGRLADAGGEIAKVANDASKIIPDVQRIDATGNVINDARNPIMESAGSSPQMPPQQYIPMQEAPINRAMVPNDLPQSAGLPRQNPLPDFATDPNAVHIPSNSDLPVGVDANQAQQVGHELNAMEQTRNPIQSLNQKINYANALPDADKTAFQNLVNTRNAVPLEAIRDASIFKPLDEQGINAIHNFESGATGGLYDQLRSTLDAQLAKEQSAGLDVGHLDNYLPHKYANSLQDINQATGKYLGQNPGFTKLREIPSYKDAIAQGLTPKTDKISELIQQRITEGNKAIANKQYFDDLVQKGQLVAPSEAPKGWVEVTKLPYKSSYTDTQGISHITNGTYMAPPQIGKVINNYLADGDGLSKLAGIIGSTKSTIMSTGIPGTGINAHGFNIMARATQAANNPIQGLAKSIQYSLRPNSAAKFLEGNMNEAIKLVKGGMTMKTEGMEFAKSIEDGASALGKLGNKFSDLKGVFEKPLFQKVIPGLKTYYGKSIAEDLISKGMNESEAYQTAAHQMNTVFGGINYDELGRSKTFQNVLRMTFFAPDWAETNIRIAGSIAKSANFTDKSLGVYRNYARNFILSYAAANVANKAMTGHWMFENAAGNEFNLELPGHAPDGSLRSVRIFGTANDFLRLPFSGAAGIAKGDGGNSIINTFKSHMNPLINSVIEELANKDYLGRAVRPDATHSMNLGQILTGQMNALGNNFLPPQLVAGVNAVTGNANIDQTIASLTGAPLRDTQGASTDAQKRLVAGMQAQGMSGDQINQALQNERATNNAKYNKSGSTSGSNSNQSTSFQPTSSNFQSNSSNFNPNTFIQQANTPQSTNVSTAGFNPTAFVNQANMMNNSNQQSLGASMPLNQNNLSSSMPMNPNTPASNSTGNMSSVLQQLLQNMPSSSGGSGRGRSSRGGGGAGGAGGLGKPGTYHTAMNGKVSTTRLSAHHRRPTKGYPYKSMIIKKNIKKK